MSELKKHSETQIVGRFYASTKTRYGCGVKNEVGLEVFVCEYPTCGYTCDRDIHVTRNILKEALRIGAERIRDEDKVSKIYSMIPEAQDL